MPRKSLQGCTCGVSCDGGRARALQPISRPAALQPTHPHLSITFQDDRDLALQEFLSAAVTRQRGIASASSRHGVRSSG
ncbi:hypothetical protein XarbCFBP7610_18380 [Xanthomonas arboricola]|nr:hypothetical protein XarbCFBP7610_18380 [Xanthomonas arboricola]